MIPYGCQDITQADIDAVLEVMRSDLLTQGPVVPRFERALADKVGAAHATAVNSATSALHIACLALGLGKGDWIWTSPISFVASANCGLYCGAQIDFVDIDPHTYNLCPVALANKLEKAKLENRLPKVVVAVHFGGQSCDMRAIYKLAQEFGFGVIEDASHAIGGKYHQEYIGGGQYSDITVFSFHPVKIITCAEGGMAVTNDALLAERMDLLRSHGISRDPERMTHPPDGPWYYQQLELGFNYRLTELQAALGLSQLERLDAYVERRRVLAQSYDELLRELPLITPWQSSENSSAWHLYVIRLELDKLRKSHRAVFEQLRAAGVGVNLHYIPIHTQPYYQKMGFKWGDFPEAERYYRDAISLPLFPAMTDEQHQRVASSLKATLG